MFENNLKAARLQNNLTQQQLADLIGIRQTVYSRYERGVNDMSVSLAKALCANLNVDMNYLTAFYEEDKETLAEYAKRDEIEQLRETIEKMEQRIEMLENE